MTQAIDSTTLSFILSASVAMAFAVYFGLSRAIHAIMNPRMDNVSDWHSAKLRWDKLRSSSPVFRTAERWIIGLADLLESRLGWFGGVPTRKDFFGRCLVRSFTLLFGDPRKLKQAVRINSSQQPWTVFEVAGVALLIAFHSSGLALMCFCVWVKPLTLGLLVVGAFVGAYRGWIWYFVYRSSRQRQEVRRFLPHAMDTIAMVMSSGDPFLVGLESVVRDFPEQPLSQEFARLRMNVNRGQTVKEGLRIMANSICLPEFDEMVRVLSRIQEHGAAASDDFTRLARQLRMTRLRQMEDEVGKSEATIAIPIMLVMFSAMIVSAAPFLLALMQSDLIR